MRLAAIQAAAALQRRQTPPESRQSKRETHELAGVESSTSRAQRPTAFGRLPHLPGQVFLPSSPGTGRFETPTATMSLVVVRASVPPLEGALRAAWILPSQGCRLQAAVGLRGSRTVAAFMKGHVTPSRPSGFGERQPLGHADSVALALTPPTVQYFHRPLRPLSAAFYEGFLITKSVKKAKSDHPLPGSGHKTALQDAAFGLSPQC